MTTDDAGLARFREALDVVQAYKPGKLPVRTDGRPTYKLSSNENPYPPLPGVLEAAAKAAGEMNRYPDYGSIRLLEALSERFGASTENIAVATGSVALIFHLAQATLETGSEAVYAWRSFEAYPIAVAVAGGTSVQVPLTADARHDFKAMEAALTERTRLVFVCTPNNPTGPAVHTDELVAFVNAVPRDVPVVVDAAYQEFVRDPDAPEPLDLFRDRPNVVVLRTFSKAYGLAGLRVGFAIGHESVVQAIRKCALPFGVNHVAQAAAIASLQAEDALLERVGALVAERTRVTDALREAGWDVPDAQGNFLWLTLGDDTLAFSQALDAEGVAVRPFVTDATGSGGVRVSIGEPAGNDLFLQVATAWKGARR
jgi:histidinol-phosphate aminotransferase